MLSVLVAAAAPALAAAGFATTDVTVYRVWPKTGDADVFGLTNVDSGDAGGDALFGISQLLLPQLCAVEPSFLWCENRGHLSGGDQWMVYTEYTVTTKSAFGEYGARIVPLSPRSLSCDARGTASADAMRAAQTARTSVLTGGSVCTRRVCSALQSVLERCVQRVQLRAAAQVPGGQARRHLRVPRLRRRRQHRPAASAAVPERL